MADENAPVTPEHCCLSCGHWKPVFGAHGVCQNHKNYSMPISGPHMNPLMISAMLRTLDLAVCSLWEEKSMQDG